MTAAETNPPIGNRLDAGLAWVRPFAGFDGRGPSGPDDEGFVGEERGLHHAGRPHRGILSRSALSWLRRLCSPISALCPRANCGRTLAGAHRPFERDPGRPQRVPRSRGAPAPPLGRFAMARTSWPSASPAPPCPRAQFESRRPSTSAREHNLGYIFTLSWRPWAANDDGAGLAVLETLPGYVDALKRDWSPTTSRDDATRGAPRGDLEGRRGFVASLVDREAKGGPIAPPTGPAPAPARLSPLDLGRRILRPIGFRWQPGTEAPPTCLGHIGFTRSCPGSSASDTRRRPCACPCPTRGRRACAMSRSPRTPTTVRRSGSSKRTAACWWRSSSSQPRSAARRA